MVPIIRHLPRRARKKTGKILPFTALQDILIAVSKVRIESKTLVEEAENEAVHQMQKMEGREPVLCEKQT
jgi:hypothetical protein